jgi:hypothetical protein
MTRRVQLGNDDAANVKCYIIIRLRANSMEQQQQQTLSNVVCPGGPWVAL